MITKMVARLWHCAERTLVQFSHSTSLMVSEEIKCWRHWSRDMGRPWGQTQIKLRQTDEMIRYIKGRLHQFHTLKCVYRSWGALLLMWKSLLWFQRKLHVIYREVTRWLSCIVGNVGTTYPTFSVRLLKICEHTFVKMVELPFEKWYSNNF